MRQIDDLDVRHEEGECILRDKVLAIDQKKKTVVRDLIAQVSTHLREHVTQHK